MIMCERDSKRKSILEPTDGGVTISSTLVELTIGVVWLWMQNTI